MTTESNRSRIEMCKMMMMFKIRSFDNQLGEKLYSYEEFRQIYGITEFSIETNVAASTELSQSGDLDIFYQVNCSHCDSVNSFMELDPMNGPTMKDLANGKSMCKFCDHEIRVNMTEKDPFKLFYRISQRHIGTNTETHLLIDDENYDESYLDEPILKRIFNSIRGRK